MLKTFVLALVFAGTAVAQPSDDAARANFAQYFATRPDVV
jgi:hypothetical protein